MSSANFGLPVLAWLHINRLHDSPMTISSLSLVEDVENTTHYESPDAAFAGRIAEIFKPGT